MKKIDPNKQLDLAFFQSEVSTNSQELKTSKYDFKNSKNVSQPKDQKLSKQKENEFYETKTVRCRTIGDVSCTGLTLSSANSLEDIIQEIAATRNTERGGRADDQRSEAAMEDRKKEGYF